MLNVFYKKLNPDVVALFLLLFMASFMIYEAWNDSGTMDEAAHIPAGYSYVIKKDMRLNPEHPPLVKFLSGLSILILVKDVNFPQHLPSWKENINDQWSFGFDFLYRSGNDADKIIFSARLPAILLTLILGIVIFIWAGELWGKTWALLPLSIFTFSSNFVGHGHLVTTDIGATLGVLLSLWRYLHYINNPSKKNFWLSSFSIGFALLLKFSTVVVIPIILLITIIKLIQQKNISPLIQFIKVGIVSLAIVWIFYAWHVWNYPQDRQLKDAQFILTSYGIKPLKNLDFWLIKNKLMRPLGQYLLGLLMNMQRAAGGNTTYFMGEVSAAGWRWYFPIVYHLKESIPVLILIYAGFILGLIGWLKHKKIELSIFSMISFVVLYWILSILSPLNIGVRHIFPTLPFLYILITGPISKFLSCPKVLLEFNFKEEFKFAFRWIVFSVIIFWMIIEFFLYAPWHIAYFNEIAGGPSNAYRYVVDSNLDWGQALKALKKFVIKNNIPKIKIDYFGGGDAKYYLGDRFEPLKREEGPQIGWLAISATFLQGERGKPAPGFDQPCCRYIWLNNYEPIEKVGYSIFVYYISP
jgi:hypothetical protein